MASDFLATDLDISVRKNPDSGLYEFGVVWQDAFVVLAMRKTGGIDDDIARAADAVAAAAEEEAAASSKSKSAG